MAKKKEYDVGKGKPPKEHQFKPRQSGNPKGRPKGSKNFRTDVKNTLNSKVDITEGGRAKKVTAQLATLMRLREKALKGDVRALDRLMSLAQTYNDEDTPDTSETSLSRSDEAILESYHERRNRTAMGSAETEEPTNDNDSFEESDSIEESDPIEESGSPKEGEDSKEPDSPEETDDFEEDDDDDWLR